MLKKRTADAEDHKNKKKNKNKKDNNKDNNDHNPNKRQQGGHGGGRGARYGKGGRSCGQDGGRGEFRSSKIDGNKPCPVHPRTKHTWSQCSKNRDNPNGGGKFQRGGCGGRFDEGRGPSRGNFYHHYHQIQYDNNYHNYNQ